MKKLALIVFIGVVVGGSAYYLSATNENKEELVLHGNIEIRQVTLGFQVAGKISSMAKEEGDSVTKGEVIAEIESDDYKNSLEKAAAIVKQTEAVSKEARVCRQINLEYTIMKAIVIID